jgi:hypothetical protein
MGSTFPPAGYGRQDSVTTGSFEQLTGTTAPAHARPPGRRPAVFPSLKNALPVSCELNDAPFPNSDIVGSINP